MYVCLCSSMLLLLRCCCVFQQRRIRRCARTGLLLLLPRREGEERGRGEMWGEGRKERGEGGGRSNCCG